MKKDLVSVIVTTKNSEKTIEKCLQSVKNQTYKNIELIVVDNNSSDETKTIAKKFTNNIFNKGPERSSQRNFGIAKSHGELLLFLDSDMYLSKKVVEECLQKIDEEDVIALYIPEKILGHSFWSKLRTFERSFYNETPIDAVRFVKKNVLTKLGGFDEKLFAGEDWDFNIRIKQTGNVTIISAPLFHDESDVNFFSYIGKKSYYSENLQLYQKKWQINTDVQKQFSAYYRFIGVFFENGKWKKVLAHPFLFLCVIMLKCFVGLQFVLTKSQHNN